VPLHLAYKVVIVVKAIMRVVDKILFLLLLINLLLFPIPPLAQDEPFKGLKVLTDELEITPPMIGAIRIDGTTPPLYLYTDKNAENFGIRRINFPNGGFMNQLVTLEVTVIVKNGGSTIPVSILDRDVKGFTTQIFAVPIVNLNNNTRLILKYWAAGY
jgi:type II secretory pathway component HofQ